MRSKPMLLGMVMGAAHGLVVWPVGVMNRGIRTHTSTLLMCDGVPSLREQMQAYIETQQARGVPLTEQQLAMMAEFEADDELLEQTGRVDFTKSGHTNPGAPSAHLPGGTSPDAFPIADQSGDSIAHMYGGDMEEEEWIDPATGMPIPRSDQYADGASQPQYGDPGYGLGMGGKQQLPSPSRPSPRAPPPSMQGGGGRPLPNGAGPPGRPPPNGAGPPGRPLPVRC